MRVALHGRTTDKLCQIFHRVHCYFGEDEFNYLREAETKYFERLIEILGVPVLRASPRNGIPSLLGVDCISL